MDITERCLVNIVLQGIAETPGKGVFNPVLILGYVSSWNTAIMAGVDDWQEIPTWLTQKKSIMVVKRIGIRGGDTSANLRMRWGYAVDPRMDRWGKNVKRFQPNAILLDNPLVPPTYNMVHGVLTATNSLLLADQNSWNGVMVDPAFNIGIPPEQRLYFLFYDLCVYDFVYITIIYDHVYEK